MLHSRIAAGDLHAVANWVVADSTARLAVIPTALDVGKICWQQDNDSFWVLKDDSPVTWINFTSLGFTPENAANRGAAGGYAPLDGSAKVPAANLPSYVSAILEYADYASLPVTGDPNIIYVTVDTNKTYRWSGSSYVEVSPSIGTDLSFTAATRTLASSTGSDVILPEATTTEAGLMPAQSGTSSQVRRGDGSASTFASTELSDYTAVQAKFDGKTNMFGFPVDSSGNYLCTLTYNETTRTVTVTPTAASFDVWVAGVKYTFTGAQSIAHAATQGGHFVYVDHTGTIVTGTTPWDLLRHAPICYIMWDATNSRGIPFEERHHAGRDVWWHRNQHTAEGTKATSGFGISGYTLNSGAADTAVTFAIATGRAEDEDIRVDTQALPDNGPYTILERAGAAGDWSISRTSVLPFAYSGNNLQYNQNTGATWQRTNVTEDYYTNVWVFGLTALPTTDMTPAPTATQQIAIILGQTIHATSSAATAETVSSLSWGTMPFQELVPLYQITLHYNATGVGNYNNTARCAIVSLTRIVGTSATITQTGSADHGALTGLTDDDHVQYAKTEGTHRVVLNVTDPPTDGHALKYDQATGKWIAGAVAGTLAGLSDVNITTPADGAVLKYDQASGKWIDGTDNTGGGTVTKASLFMFMGA